MGTSRKQWPGSQSRSQWYGSVEITAKHFAFCVIPASLGPQASEKAEGNPVEVTILFARPYQEEIVTSISRLLSTDTHPSYAVPASVLAHNRIP